MANKKATTQKKSRRTPVTTYVPVASNVYFDGTSYRVRVIKNGVRNSKNFSSKRAALQYRKQLLG